MRRFPKTDGNQPEIVRAFRKFGCSVEITTALGSGFPDLVVGKNRKTVLVEVKDGNKPPSKQKLTADEQKFCDKWQGSYFVVKDLSDVIALVRALER